MIEGVIYHGLFTTEGFYHGGHRGHGDLEGFNFIL